MTKTEVYFLAHAELQRQLEVFLKRPLTQEDVLPMKELRAKQAVIRAFIEKSTQEPEKPIHETPKPTHTPPEHSDENEDEREITKTLGGDPDGAEKFDNALSGKGPLPGEEPPAPKAKKIDPYSMPDEKASAAQGKMIFAMLGTDFAIKDELQKKAVVRGFINDKAKPGDEITSTKDLTKAQAGDLITWLQKEATVADLNDLIARYEEPFNG